MAEVLTIESQKNSRPFLNEDHLLFQQSLRKFLEKEAVPFFDQWEKDGLVPRSFWKKVGGNGFLCPWIDEQYGGLGADFGFSVILAEELGRVGAGLGGISLHCDIVAPYIASFGTVAQKEKYLPLFLTGEMISAIAMTEPGAGSDLANIQATAEKKDDHYIINGTKTFITNGYQADFIIVAVKTDLHAKPAHKGISLFIIEKDTPGFSRGKKLEKIGQHASDTAELFFENAIVSTENLIGEEGMGFFYLMQKLQQERLLCAIGAQLSAEDMLFLTLAYIKEREAFGRKISQFQNTQFTIAEMATEIQLGRTFVDDLIVKHIQGKDIVTEVSMAKYWITEMAKRASGKCMQLHGGYGYMEEYKIARRYRDIPVTTIFAGSNEIMKIIIAKNLGL
ncbi:acyl-CoA dehydrogenase family protein [Bacillus sp. CECT 9360]|uniref:acyl-CoA dehydrogenase family protein n=1 Tax=Bacillus sp. CECT 9360 TaxID=2845821 RepID=UPI001E2C7AA0|nr:acyl-CoA dehydrogenase family protein [Bacillus sp. CECT 9360]CAH0344007.1 Acyl-CoA dehydrogenase [Bacillus sp. CECT 9360]